MAPGTSFERQGFPNPPFINKKLLCIHGCAHTNVRLPAKARPAHESSEIPSAYTLHEAQSKLNTRPPNLPVLVIVHVLDFATLVRHIQHQDNSL